MTEHVYHTRYGIELDLSLDDLGHPDRPGLWEEIYRSRPFDPGLLRCTDMGLDGASCREPMYVTIRHRKRIACHVNASAGPHASPSSEISRRKALKERIAVSAQHAGFEALLEDKAAGGGRGVGVLVKGRGGHAIGWEVQFRQIGADTVRRRSRRAHAHGVMPMWTVDDRKSAAIDRAPWTRLDRVADWRRYADRNLNLNVRGGVRELRMERCDERRATPCPERGWGRCGDWHACWDLALGVYLDDLIARSASGDYVPLFLPAKTRRGGNHMWVTTKDKTDFLQDRPEPSPWEVEDQHTSDDHGYDNWQPTEGVADAGLGFEPDEDHGERIDAAVWLTASAEAGPGLIGVADRYRPPQDLVELRNAFVRVDKQYSDIVRGMPSGLAIARGTAAISPELRARSAAAYDERAAIVQRLYRHWWWSTVDNRRAAEQELRKVARDQVT
ncbi:hypothetical protein GCM10009839_60690 [Catenulispora yoronensis]|uniref:Uncharacterized protein n=1 Tax=Catenulispora yoronensis TaxID=450799 RepID=A0ABP5GLB6_9ACTN